MKYRRKHTPDVEAIQWNGSNYMAVNTFLDETNHQPPASLNVAPNRLGFYCFKARATVGIDVGDWIIRELDGTGCYPCERDVFAMTYEEAN